MELKGKVINFIGDSITEGHGVENIETGRYDNIMKRKAELGAVYNYGVSGTRIAHQKTASQYPRHDMNFCGRAYDINPKADITVVFGGTNDYGHGDVPFGNPTDNTPDTFCGAVDFLMRLLKDMYPNMTLIFMTPARRINDESPSQNLSKTSDAKPLRAYVDLIIEKGKKFDIPVLDLYENLGINPNIESDNTIYTTDGLHFNDKGQEVIADCLIDFLKNLD